MYRLKYLLSLIIQKLLTIVNIYDTSELIDLTNQTLRPINLISYSINTFLL